jgi:Cytochrome C oxidase, cbb3-type, subunit III
LDLIRSVNIFLGLQPPLTGLRLPRRVKPYLLGIGLLMALIPAVGCAQGAYPLDIFYEMHYQPSFKSHEPPRLSVPEESVAWFPPPRATSFTGDGRYLYEVNCSMCHGQTGQGDGRVLQRMISIYGYQPAVTPDLTSQQVKAIGVTGIQGFVVNGLVVMPSFTNLLTEEEIQLIAEYVVNCLQEAQPQVCP